MRTVLSFLVMLSYLLSNDAFAAISLSATRLIYGELDRDSSISIVNTGEQDVLIQSWLENNDGNMLPPPFAVTPPLAKLSRKDRQLLRVLFKGQGLPKEKESVFWLNVQEIPQVVDGGNILQLALLQRVKLFYRPAGLIGDANSAPQHLKVKLMHNQLELHNPTPYHINMVNFKQGDYEIDMPMIEPGERVLIPVDNINSNDIFSILTVNDYGAIVKYQASFNKGVANSLTITDK
ncbi:fimbrial biogenesis chaperone [Vibrio cholerae]|uniref:fimbrial biogenesis chaperone n=3 Tax=Vibrio cholerae TaxID=666 RepID=UPI0013B46957|nr:molecular chaperone [Vibrio cholerae]EJL6306977.1 molecular chaperone [Vibrio cholerae]EJL6586540.1 molecular chaperone [Vibrio cholerae]EJL6932162.1 molecular chaperone [Vibrio cholerae]EKF9440689.1 molecular chaperone [Vibrio cholerae]EKF9740503.1 molecular chaperone [Vibrio cholerae]